MGRKEKIFYVKPIVTVQKIEVEACIAASVPVIHPSDGSITEDWEEEIISPSGDIDLKDY